MVIISELKTCGKKTKMGTTNRKYPDLKKWSLLFVLMIFCIACNFVNDRRYLTITFNDSKLNSVV